MSSTAARPIWFATPPAGRDRARCVPFRMRAAVFGATCLTPSTGATIRSLAAVQPTTLGLMHGPSCAGDCVQALNDLATFYDTRLATEGARLAVPHVHGLLHTD